MGRGGRTEAAVLFTETGHTERALEGALDVVRCGSLISQTRKLRPGGKDLLKGTERVRWGVWTRPLLRLLGPPPAHSRPKAPHLGV